MSARESKQIANLRQLLETLLEKQHLLQMEEIKSVYPADRLRIRSELDEVKKQIEHFEGRLETVLAADAAVDKVESLAVDVAGNLQTLQMVEGDVERVKALEEQITSLVETSTKTIEQLKERSLTTAIEPKLSVLRPNVKLVDANLAYRYADYQSDANILFGFTTLFFGTGIASITSLGIAIATKADNVVIAIHSTATVISILVTVLFGLLTRRALKKADEAQEEFEAGAGEREILLQSIIDKSNQTDEPK